MGRVNVCVCLMFMLIYNSVCLLCYQQTCIVLHYCSPLRVCVCVCVCALLCENMCGCMREKKSTRERSSSVCVCLCS